jgi:Lon protease-like protein
MAASKTAMLPDPLPLFPLQSVFYPDARLALRVFEARYLDLIADCLRRDAPFGVVCLRQGREAGPSPQPVVLETVGVLASAGEVDAVEAGILRVRSRCGQRFRIVETPVQAGDGLWRANAAPLPPDPHREPGPAMAQTVAALRQAIGALDAQGRQPFDEPYRLDDAGWVANRWCELLPLPLAFKQRLLELDDPVIRLSLVDAFLRDKKVIPG